MIFLICVIAVMLGIAVRRLRIHILVDRCFETLHIDYMDYAKLEDNGFARGEMIAEKYLEQEELLKWRIDRWLCYYLGKAASPAFIHGLEITRSLLAHPSAEIFSHENTITVTLSIPQNLSMPTSTEPEVVISAEVDHVPLDLARQIQSISESRFIVDDVIEARLRNRKAR